MQNELENSQKLDGILQTYQLNAKETTFIAMKIKGNSMEEISKALNISLSSTYRFQNRPRIKLAMADIMTVTVTDSVVGLNELVNETYKLWGATLRDTSLPLPVRLACADSVHAALSKNANVEMQNRITNAFFEQMAPLPTAIDTSGDFDLLE